MAGNGGFKSAINGFDKNEVNEYIGNLRKKLQEMEAEIKSNEEKTKAAVKTAEEADSKISDLQKQNAQRVAELEAQVKTERRNADNLQNEVDELKRKLRHAGNGAASGSAANNAAAAAEAEKRAAEIVDKANATARDIVEKAKQTAHQIISGAGGTPSGGVSAESLEAFNAILRDLTKSVTDALNTANKKASGITGAPAAPAIDLSAFAAPQAEVPAPKAAPAPASKAASVDDIFADLADDGGDMADFGDIKPLDPPKPDHEVVEGFDLSDVGNFIAEEPVSEVSPIDGKKENRAVLDEDFTAELLTQTVPSSALKDQVDEDLFSAVKEREEEFAVQPSDKKDFDMGDPADGLDAMNALLGQMGAALESAGGSASLDLGEPEPAVDNTPSDNPWADLQNQLNAMEESGNFGGSEPAAEPETMSAPTEDPKAPDADDSSIWNFDDDMSSDSSDDDMSADLFGSF